MFYSDTLRFGLHPANLMATCFQSDDRHFPGGVTRLLMEWNSKRWIRGARSKALERLTGTVAMGTKKAA